MRKFDLAKVTLVETNETLKKRSREPFNGSFTTAYRIEVSFAADDADESALTDEEKRVLAKTSAKARKLAKRNLPSDIYSGIFRMENILNMYLDKNGKVTPFLSQAKRDENNEPILADVEFSTPENGYEDERQDKLINAVKEEYASINNELACTAYSFSVEELLNGTKYEGTKTLYYKDDDDEFRELTRQKRLYLGLHKDEARALQLCRENLLRGIEDDEDLFISLPKKEEKKNEQSKAEKSAKGTEESLDW